MRFKISGKGKPKVAAGTSIFVCVFNFVVSISISRTESHSTLLAFINCLGLFCLLLLLLHDGFTIMFVELNLGDKAGVTFRAPESVGMGN